MTLYNRKNMWRVLNHIYFRRRRAGAALFVLGSLACFSAAQTFEDFDAAFRALKRDEKLQFDLPIPVPHAPAPPPKTPAWMDVVFGFFEKIFAFLAPFLPWIFYGLLGLAVAAVLYFILRDVIGRKFPQSSEKVAVEEPPAPLYAPTSEEARVLLKTVDALAAEGRFEEAVHTLLFRSIQDIDLKRPNRIRRSLTSREISQLDILTEETRVAFVLIGRVVENSFFGGRKLGQSDFQNCRDAYEQFAVAKAWT